ncbi:MAG: hypothetical protein RJA98_2424, partial [Pseudomonadota bacterium]
MLKRLASNAAANLSSGLVAACCQLAATGFATRIWHGSEFSTWALALSISAIAPLFGVNLSSVVTRRLVQDRHTNRGVNTESIIRGANKLSRQLTFWATILLFSAGLVIYASTPGPEDHGSTLILLLPVFLLSNIWQILWQTAFGRHYSEERNWPPTVTQGAARVGGLLGLISTCTFISNSPIYAATGLLIGTWTALAACTAAFKPRSIAKKPVTTPLNIDSQYLETRRVFVGFGIWSLGSLVIQYGIPPIIAALSPATFNAFYIASTLNLIAIGALSSAMSALLAPVTRWHTGGQQKRLRQLAYFGPIVCCTICLLAFICEWLAL